MSRYRAENLADYLARVAPDNQSTGRLRIVARECQLCQILQGSREGWGVELSEESYALALALNNAMASASIAGRYQDTFVTVQADLFVERVARKARK